MLYSIVTPKHFKACIERVNDTLGKGAAYSVLDSEGTSTPRVLPLPLAQELWAASHPQPQGDWDPHHSNVVAALARLIDFFSHRDNLERVFDAYSLRKEARSPGDGEARERKDEVASLVGVLAYGDETRARLPNRRSFRLMLAGFYHDVGKSVRRDRHAREGYALLADDSTSTIAELSAIAHAYRPNEWGFDCEDAHFVAALVDYHDLFGTLATGENGYLRTCGILNRLRRYSLRHRSIDGKLNWSKRYLFDLWLLNIADIMVSLERKGEYQIDWSDEAGAKARITGFFGLLGEGSTTKPGLHRADCLVHDLLLCLKLLEQYSEFRHTSDLEPLMGPAYDFSRRHVVERLRRIIMAVASSALMRQHSERSAAADEIATEVLEGMTEEHIAATAVRSINTLCSLDRFCADAAWIGQLDYALSFLVKVFLHAGWRAQQEQELYEAIGAEGEAWARIEGSVLQAAPRALVGTGWVRSELGTRLQPDLAAKMRATCFLNNFTHVVVQMLWFILCREGPLDRVRSLEFQAAGASLTAEKADKLIGLEGPYRAARARELLLDNVFVY